ncbi:MAG: hypothetical protein JSV31_18850 [Desulfobacterales bacterium]|nr:MAG: hypothetical protein JSV31_18850 [Desulfobacterales bacterium]
MRANVASLLSAGFKTGGSENTALLKKGDLITQQGGQNHHVMEERNGLGGSYRKT